MRRGTDSRSAGGHGPSEKLWICCAFHKVTVFSSLTNRKRNLYRPAGGVIEKQNLQPAIRRAQGPRRWIYASNQARPSRRKKPEMRATGQRGGNAPGSADSTTRSISMDRLDGPRMKRGRKDTAAGPQEPRKRRRTIGIMPLEPRIMYDGA